MRVTRWAPSGNIQLPRAVRKSLREWTGVYDYGYWADNELVEDRESYNTGNCTTPWSKMSEDQKLFYNEEYCFHFRCSDQEPLLKDEG